MTSREVKNYIDAELEREFPKKIIADRICFLVKDAFYVSVDVMGVVAVVLMYADTVQDAQRGIFDDADAYDIDRFAPDDILELMLSQIKKDI